MYYSHSKDAQGLSPFWIWTVWYPIYKERGPTLTKIKHYLLASNRWGWMADPLTFKGIPVFKQVIMIFYLGT